SVQLSVLLLHFVDFYFSYCSASHRHLHSFPTRRSSDLFQVRSLRVKRYWLANNRLSPSSAHRKIPGSSAAILSIRKGSSTRLGSDRKSTRLNSSHVSISYAVFCLKKKTQHKKQS